MPADMLSARAVTLTSALIALVIASVESLAVLASTMHWKGAFWTLMINAPFEVLGYLIIGASSHLPSLPASLPTCLPASLPPCLPPFPSLSRAPAPTRCHALYTLAWPPAEVLATCALTDCVHCVHLLAGLFVVGLTVSLVIVRCNRA